MIGFTYGLKAIPFKDSTLSADKEAPEGLFVWLRWSLCLEQLAASCTDYTEYAGAQENEAGGLRHRGRRRDSGCADLQGEIELAVGHVERQGAVGTGEVDRAIAFRSPDVSGISGVLEDAAAAVVASGAAGRDGERLAVGEVQ